MLEDIGRIKPPLGVVNLGGDTKLIVSPWAAIGTDALLVATGTTVILIARPTILKLLGFVGTGWGIVAMLLEISKLISGSTGTVEGNIVRESA